MSYNLIKYFKSGITMCQLTLSAYCSGKSLMDLIGYNLAGVNRRSRMLVTKYRRLVAGNWVRVTCCGLRGYWLRGAILCRM